MGKVILWVGDKEERCWIGEHIFDDLNEPRIISSDGTTKPHPEEINFLITLAKQRIHAWIPQDIAWHTIPARPLVIHEALWVWLEVVEGKAMSYRFPFDPPLELYEEGEDVPPVQED